MNENIEQEIIGVMSSMESISAFNKKYLEKLDEEKAIEYLNEAGAGRRYILIFSDLKQELAEGYVRDIPFQLEGFDIVALNVTKLRSDNVDPREYMDRLEDWQRRVEEGGGSWRVINDMDRLERIING